MKTLVIDLIPEHAAGGAGSDLQAIRLDEIRALGTWGTLRRLRRESFDACSVIVPEFRTPSPWLSMVLLALLSRADRRTMIDGKGEERAVSWRGLVSSEIPFAVSRARTSRRLARETRRAIDALRPAGSRRAIVPRRIALLRSDVGSPLVAGGSLAHLQGVVSGFRSAGRHCALFSPAPVAGIEDTRVVAPDPTAAVSVEVPHLAYNSRVLRPLLDALRRDGFDLVYQRHALGAYAGAAAAQALALPLVVEFNGSEVWIARNWGSARAHMDLFDEIERRVLAAADLVVAVSEPLRKQLLDLGVGEERILINPNGVLAERFDPDSHAAARPATRAHLGAREDDVVVTFVGTFGPWHGAEVFARAALLVPEAVRAKFVFIGDGPGRPRTEAILRDAGALDRAAFTGLVPQDETPAYLAASDVCVSPHVPNADGSTFFGSPTKLFEYMASGRAIVASRLGQIGEVLEHGRNGWLVPPGDARALADAIVLLASEPELRGRLGGAAAADAIREHTWDAHVARILERLGTPR